MGVGFHSRQEVAAAVMGVEETEVEAAEEAAAEEGKAAAEEEDEVEEVMREMMWEWQGYPWPDLSPSKPPLFPSKIDPSRSDKAHQRGGRRNMPLAGSAG